MIDRIFYSPDVSYLVLLLKPELFKGIVTCKYLRERILESERIHI